MPLNSLQGSSGADARNTKIISHFYSVSTYQNCKSKLQTEIVWYSLETDFAAANSFQGNSKRTYIL